MMLKKQKQYTEIREKPQSRVQKKKDSNFNAFPDNESDIRYIYV